MSESQRTLLQTSFTSAGSLPEQPSATSVQAPTVNVAKFSFWNKNAISFARDFLFLVGIFTYLIGYTYHSSTLAQFGMETDLADQPITALLTWAAEAFAHAWQGFAVIFGTIALMVAVAGYCKYRYATWPHCVPFLYGVTSVAMVFGCVSTYEWSSAAGICVAHLKRTGNEELSRVVLRPLNGVYVPGLSSDEHAPTPVQILAETNSEYQVLITSGSQPILVAVPRSVVGSIQYAVAPLPAANPKAPAVPIRSLPLNQSGMTTPPPSAVGASLPAPSPPVQSAFCNWMSSAG